MLRVASWVLVAGLLPAGWSTASPADKAPAQMRVPVWAEPGVAPGAESFDVTLNGAPSRILAIKGPGDDLLLMAVLDMTQDLTQATLAKDALVEGVRRLPAKTAVSVLRAQDSLKVLANPTTDRAEAAEAIQSLPISGKAGLLETVEFLGRTGDAILQKTAVRVAVLYVTDSDIQNYRENFANPTVNSSGTRDLSRKFPETLVQERISRLAAQLSHQQTPLFIVHLLYRADRLNQAYQSGIKQLAETTGGTARFCRSNAEVGDAIGKTLETINSHYSLTLAAPEQASGPVKVHITANGPNGGKAVTYRTRVSLKSK